MVRRFTCDMLYVQTRKGFTLLEVLLALVIFTIAVVVLGASYLNVLSSYEMIRQNQAEEEDLRFVRSLALQEPDREELERGGDVESLYLGWVRWRGYVEPTYVADLFHVTLEIDFEGTADVAPREVTQHFYVLRPSWSEPTERQQLREESRRRLEEARNFGDQRQW